MFDDCTLYELNDLYQKVQAYANKKIKEKSFKEHEELKCLSVLLHLESAISKKKRRGHIE